MSKNNKKTSLSHEETVPTYTIGAAFALSVILGLIVVSGVLLKPYEAREVVEQLHERIMMEKEYRELSRLGYSPSKINYSSIHESSFPESGRAASSAVLVAASSKPAKKTDRAQNFNRKVKSDDYWKNLQASISGIKPASPSSPPVVLPPVVVGSAE